MNHHPQGCQCGVCRGRPCPPPQIDAFLLPRIIGSGRETCRRLCQCLTLSGLPDCACAPFCLVSVEQSGNPVVTERLADRCGRGQLIYRVQIPVAAQVRDARGCTYAACGTVEAEAALNICERGGDLGNTQVVAFASVRLNNCPPPSDCPRFEVNLDIRIEIYLVRYEACRRSCPQEPPRCPDLPLYPQLPIDCGNRCDNRCDCCDRRDHCDRCRR